MTTQVRYYGYGHRRYGYGGYRHGYTYGYRHYGYSGYRHYGYRSYGYRPYGYGVARGIARRNMPTMLRSEAELSREGLVTPTFPAQCVSG